MLRADHCGPGGDQIKVDTGAIAHHNSLSLFTLRVLCAFRMTEAALLAFVPTL